jgi:protein AATF/BFR2
VILPSRAKKTKRPGVDRRASKGRKLRYTVHPKLEHFMFPAPAPAAPMDVDKLFASLHGRTAVPSKALNTNA